MASRTSAATSVDSRQANKAAAVRFIHGFNDDDWDTVREVVAPGFVFHHPLGGTVEAGPEGMVSTWAGFKELSPDSWHPIPIMIAEGDYVAVLLPTYGTFTGHGEHAPPPTNGRLDYGMVNIVRFENGQLAEMWFGMDSLVEMQQMGVAPSPPLEPLSPHAEANLAAFEQVSIGEALDNVVAFDDVVVAMGPPQAEPSTKSRTINIFAFADGSAEAVYAHELQTDPPYWGDAGANGEASLAIVDRWIDDVFSGHDLAAVDALVTPHVLIHPTAMPCEASFHGPAGSAHWLEEQWNAFGDLSVTDRFSVAERNIVAVRWTAQGTSVGEFIGLPPTGDRIEFTGVSMYRIEDGRIAEIWDTRNTLGILHQLNPELGAHGHHH